MEKDYSLLRPFDLESAKNGDVLCDENGECYLKYLAGPTDASEYAFENSDGTIFIAYAYHVLNKCKMRPMTWIGYRPVYKGDALIYNKKHEFIAVGMYSEGVILSAELFIGYKKELCSLKEI